MRSLQFRLSVAVSVVAAALALLAGAWSFTTALKQGEELQDRRLRAIANLFTRYELPTPQTLRDGPEAKFDAFVAVETLGTGAAHLFNLPVDTPDGHRTVVVDGERWRLFVSSAAANYGRVAVGQRTAIRNSIAWNAGLWTAVPSLLLIPFLCGVIFLLVRRMLKPVAAVSANLDRRVDSDFNPLETDNLPSEIGPIVAAINNLLRRLGRSMEMQRYFVANAAHELRSPLAALSIQVENARTLASDDRVASRLEALRHGIARARSLAEKLLALARAQTPPDAGSAGSCHVEPVLRSALEAKLPIASARNIELAVVRLEPLSVEMDELDLVLVVRNLLDNAIRYSGAGGTVEVGAWRVEQGFCLEVKDYGQGIAPAERERVFEPFYRILGSDEPGHGLGLSIVRAIVQRLGGSIELDWTLDQPPTGLKVRVVLPVRTEGQHRTPPNAEGLPLRQQHAVSNRAAP